MGDSKSGGEGSNDGPTASTWIASFVTLLHDFSFIFFQAAKLLMSSLNISFASCRFSLLAFANLFVAINPIYYFSE